MSSLQDLSLQFQESIAALVAAFSPQAIEELRGLRATCKQMHMASTSPQDGRCLPLRQVLWRAFEGYDDAVHDFGLFRDALLDSLTSDVVGNQATCYLADLREVFVDNNVALRPSLHLLERTTAAGHQHSSYMLGLCHYRPHGGADDDDKAFWLIRKAEGDEEEAAAAGAAGHGSGGPRVWKNRECVWSRYTIWRDKRALLPASELVIWDGLDGYPVPLARPVVRGAGNEYPCPVGYCGFPHRVDRWQYWAWFCSEKCRIRKEYNSVFNSYFW